MRGSWVILVVLLLWPVGCACFKTFSLWRRSPSALKSTDSPSNIDDIIARAKQTDKEWFDRVIGDGTGTNSEVVPSSESTSVASNQSESPQGRKLVELGYSIAEAELLKKSVVEQIIKREVRRPFEEIPRAWFQVDPGRVSSDQRARAPEKPSPIARPIVRPTQKVSKRPTSTVPTESNDSRDDVTRSGTSTTFTWKSTGPRVQDAQYTDISGPSPAYEEEELDSTVKSSDTSEEQLSFLPSIEEFQRVLREESRFRMRAVGAWIAPLLRVENTVRFRLYEGFLRFLDSGLGEVVDGLLALLDAPTDTEDVVPDVDAPSTREDLRRGPEQLSRQMAAKERRLPAGKTVAEWTHHPLNSNSTRASEEVVLKVTVTPRGGYICVEEQGTGTGTSVAKSWAQDESDGSDY